MEEWTCASVVFRVSTALYRSEVWSWALFLAGLFLWHTHLCWITALPLRNPSVKSPLIPANRFQKPGAEPTKNHKLRWKKFDLASEKVFNFKMSLLSSFLRLKLNIKSVTHSLARNTWANNHDCAKGNSFLYVHFNLWDFLEVVTPQKLFI